MIRNVQWQIKRGRQWKSVWSVENVIKDLDHRLFDLTSHLSCVRAMCEDAEVEQQVAGVRRLCCYLQWLTAGCTHCQDTTRAAIRSRHARPPLGSRGPANVRLGL